LSKAGAIFRFLAGETPTPPRMAGETPTPPGETPTPPKGVWASRPSSSTPRRRWLLALAGLAGGIAGCSQGVRWRLDSYENVQRLSRAEGKLTFVYFRNWYSVRCAQFEEHVLKNPEVLAATHALNCVPLEFDWDRRLAEQWGIDQTPGFVIINPQGRVVTLRAGEITVDDVLGAIARAREMQQTSEESKP